MAGPGCELDGTGAGDAVDGKGDAVPPATGEALDAGDEETGDPQPIRVTASSVLNARTTRMFLLGRCVNGQRPTSTGQMAVW
jgi:hypothetical protein